MMWAAGDALGKAGCFNVGTGTAPQLPRSDAVGLYSARRQAEHPLYRHGPRRSAALTNTSPRARSIGCSAPVIMAGFTALEDAVERVYVKGFSRLRRIAFADGAQVNRCSILKSSAKRSPAGTVLCIGDLMLDEFVLWRGVADFHRKAPAPVIAVRRSETNIGGARQCRAANIASLGARCIFVGLVGEDEAGRETESRPFEGKPHRGRAGCGFFPARRRARYASSPSIFPATCCVPTGNWRCRRAPTSSRS